MHSLAFVLGQVPTSQFEMTPGWGIIVALLSSLASGSLVGVIMKHHNEARRIELTEHDAERSRMDAEWARIGVVAEGVRKDVDQQLEMCKKENASIAAEAKALRKDVQQKGDEILELRRSYRTLADQFLVLRRQVGEVAEGTPYRTRADDLVGDDLLEPPP